MKRFSLLTTMAVFLWMGTMAADSENEKVVYTVQPEKSNVTWNGKKVTGEHTGTINLQGGELVVQENEIVNASISMDMTSIANTDLTDPQWNKKLVDHLKSDDFFSVDKFPEATFKSTGFEKSTGNSSADYVVTGDLTIKGITHPVSFPVNVEVENGQFTASGTAVLDRTKWDVKYGSGSIFKGLGDKMIYDDFEITFDLVAQKQIIN